MVVLRSSLLAVALCMASAVHVGSGQALPQRALLHVGAYHAEEAAEYVRVYGDRVVFIEAMPDAHRVCEQNAARYGQSCLNYVLWEEDKAELAFHVTADPDGNTWSSSIFELGAAIAVIPEPRRPSAAGELLLKAYRLDTLMAQTDPGLWHNFTDLVVDAQGADLQVLRGMGKLLVELPIKRAVIETSTAPLYDGQPLHSEVVQFMQNAGFSCEEAGCICEYGHCFTGFVRGSLKAGGAVPLRSASSLSRRDGRLGSQFGEDEWVLEHLGYKRNGMFVDLGARNGEYNSSTVFMERIYGYRGICLEPDPREVTYNLAPKRTCAVVDVLLGDGEEDADLCTFALARTGQIAGLDDDEYAMWLWRDANNKCKLRTVRLGDVLDAAEAPRTIDYLSIGTRDADALLQHFPFEKYRFRIISVQHDAPHIGADYQQRMRVLLESNGYYGVQDGNPAWGYPDAITTVDFYKHIEAAHQEEILKSFDEDAWTIPARHEWIGALEAIVTAGNQAEGNNTPE